MSAAAHGPLRTPPFYRGAPPISSMRSGGMAAALTGEIPVPLQQEALGLADRLVRDRLGGTFWAAAPPEALLNGRRALVCAGRSPARNRAMLNAALVATASAARIVILGAKGPRLHAAARKHGCAVLQGPVDPWPLMAVADTVHAEGTDPLATLARLAGVPVHAYGHGEYAQATAGAFAAAALLLATCYTDPFSGNAIACGAALDIVAEWRRITRANRAIGACAGMSFWKRRRMRAFLHDGNRAPPHASTPAALIAAAKRGAAAGGGAIACWSSRIPKGLAQAAAASGTPLMLVEDGFMRSRGLGSGFVPPCSIVVDASGMYYDPATPSDLETLLRDAEFPAALLERARRLTARMVRDSVTKYAAAPGALTLPDHGERPLILVPGQVSDDLSVLRGGAGIAGNEDLLVRVRARNPGGFIIYKPHPDVDAGHRAGSIPDNVALRHADCIIRDTPIASLIAAVDEVHTLTSLAGFEALLRGRKVMVYGQPFYAGWGLTEDLAPPPRRGRRLTLEQLSAGVLLIYPRYVDPVTELPCSPETLLDRLADPCAWRQTLVMRLRGWQGKARTYFLKKSSKELLEIGIRASPGPKPHG
jgi:capsular polysaccharide export protein